MSKGKKSWSVRLGLSRQGQISPSDDGGKQGWGTISGGSALSRQMRYGDPWLYGTVRGHRQIVQDPRSQGVPGGGYMGRPPAGAPILVVCSCPEFLSGTTRKMGNCKKCGGHRLAGLPLGGTCRAPSASARLRPSLAGVLRPPLDDPYDLMRRSRLVEPRSRARSISPHRHSNSRDNRSQSVVNNLQRDWFEGKTDEWTIDDRRTTDEEAIDHRRKTQKRSRNMILQQQRDADSRKSILECDVNPYLLVKKQVRDEDDFSDDLSDNALELDEQLPTLFDPSKVKSIERIPARCSVAAIGGQRIRVFSEPREVSDGDEEPDDGRGRADSEDDERGGCAKTPPTSIPIPKVSPKRPPRKQKVENKSVPVKSILKRLKQGKSGKKKSVLFNVDNVIFAPAKSEFGTVRRAPSVQESLVDEEQEEEEVRVEADEKMYKNVPKFITIPNIRDPKTTSEKIYSGVKTQIRNDKIPVKQSGIPKSINRTETAKVLQEPVKPVIPAPEIRTEEPAKIVEKEEIKPEEESELEIEIEELEPSREIVTPKEDSDQVTGENLNTLSIILVLL